MSETNRMKVYAVHAYKNGYTKDYTTIGLYRLEKEAKSAKTFIESHNQSPKTKEPIYDHLEIQEQIA